MGLDAVRMGAALVWKKVVTHWCFEPVGESDLDVNAYGQLWPSMVGEHVEQVG